MKAPKPEDLEITVKKIEKKKNMANENEIEIDALLKFYLNPSLKEIPFEEIPRSLLPFNREILSQDKKKREFQRKLYDFYQK